MQIKFGAWSGGDSANPQGTIEWARGPTDYSAGPFSMVVRNIAITDYSTGTQYQYSDMSGSQGSIVAVGGAVNGNAGGAAAAAPVVSVPAPAITSVSPSVPAGIDGDARTGFPWVPLDATTVPSAPSPTRTIAGVPSGWIVSSTGKIIPVDSPATSVVSMHSPVYCAAVFAFAAFLQLL
jgi:hypothetical protein